MERWLTPATAAELVEVDVRTIYKAIASGALRSRRTGRGGKGATRIPESALAEWREQRWSVQPARPRRRRGASL